MCELQVVGGAGASAVGWCRGPDACPLIGPLDSYKENPENPADGLKLNPGSTHRRDLKEWDNRVQVKSVKSLVIGNKQKNDYDNTTLDSLEKINAET